MNAEEIWHHKSDGELEARASPVKPTPHRSAPRVSRKQTTWLVQRVLLATVLMIGFYLFAALIALTLLWIPYAGWTYIGRFHVKIAALCVGAGLTILWALVPRRDRFVPAGPRLDESVHPRLFQMIHEVAVATGQAAPADVYLLNEVNAWVAHRGGTMGFGSHRVMGVGLPLLQALSIAEFKAVIAHEFGHYWSGDVKLGPWIYKTRAAIGRTIAGVHETFIEAPFLWYGRLFLKLTHAVSREQEFIADEVAARVAGAPALASALRRITALAPLFSAYMSRDVMPVLQAGCLPPIAAGFDEFLNADFIRETSKQIIETVEGEGHTDLFDTHPSLRDRLAALGCGRDSSARVDGGQLASTLIKDTDQQARALLAFAFGAEPIAALKAIDWNVVGESVIAVRWRDVAKSHSAWLSRLTAEVVASGRHQFIRLGSELVGSGEQNVNSGECIERAVFVFATGIGVVLLDQGWRVETGPGRPVVFTRESATFDPFAAVRALSEGLTTDDAWKAECHALGIAGQPLGQAAPIQANVTVPEPPVSERLPPSHRDHTV